MDAYNVHIYPQDDVAAEAISCKIPLFCFTEDKEYLSKIKL